MVNIKPERLNQPLLELVNAFDEIELPFAIAGAYAVAIHGHVRATQEIDALISADDAARAKSVMTGMGYRQIFADDNSATYIRHPVKDLIGIQERCDLLLSSREFGQRALRLAAEFPLQWQGHCLPVVPLETLIMMKLLAIVSDPGRPNDRADVRALIALHCDRLSIEDLRIQAENMNPEMLVALDSVLSEYRLAEENPGYGQWKSGL